MSTSLREPPAGTHEKYLKWNDELVPLLEPMPTEVLPARDGAASPGRYWYGKDGKWLPCYVLENCTAWMLQELLIEYSHLKFIYPGMPFGLIVGDPRYPQRSFTIRAYGLESLVIDAYLEYRRRDKKERSERSTRYKPSSQT